MAILSYEEYMFRWTAPAPQGFGQTIDPPCYHEYLQREVYKQDYLDLFLGKKTFERNEINGKYYVKIPDLEIRLHESYTIFHDKQLFILVDYKYPWTCEELKVRSIEYIMIGEAAPSDMAYFFYYILNLQHEKTLKINKNNKIIKDYKGYVTAPYSAIIGNPAKKCNNSDKRDILIEFAKKGVLLVDLFPFAVDYDKLRNRLIKKEEKSLSFICFKKLEEEITLLTNKISFHKEFKSVLIAPTKISYQLAKIINEKNVSVLNLKKGENRFSEEHDNKNNFFFIDIQTSNLLNNHYKISIPSINKKSKEKKIKALSVPIYKCCAYSEAGTVPHATFIKNALGL